MGNPRKSLLKTTPIKLAIAIMATKPMPDLALSGAAPGAKNPSAKIGVTYESVYPNPAAMASVKVDPNA